MVDQRHKEQLKDYFIDLGGKNRLGVKEKILKSYPNFTTLNIIVKTTKICIRDVGGHIERIIMDEWSLFK